MNEHLNDDLTELKEDFKDFAKEMRLEVKNILVLLNKQSVDTTILNSKLIVLDQEREEARAVREAINRDTIKNTKFREKLESNWKLIVGIFGILGIGGVLQIAEIIIPIVRNM